MNLCNQPKQFLVAISFICSIPAFSQVGIDTDHPHEKSALEIVSKSSNTGVLFPRLTTAQIIALTPSSNDVAGDGLWIYNTDTKCYNYWATAPKNNWVELCGKKISTNPSNFEN